MTSGNESNQPKNILFAFQWWPQVAARASVTALPPRLDTIVRSFQAVPDPMAVRSVAEWEHGVVFMGGSGFH